LEIGPHDKHNRPAAASAAGHPAPGEPALSAGGVFRAPRIVEVMTSLPSSSLEKGTAVKILSWFPLLFVLCVAAGPVYSDGEKRAPSNKGESSFGALKSAEAAEAQKQAAAWLKEAKSDAGTQAKFDAIWASDRPVIDKVAATFALGDADAAKLLAEARDPEASAPT